MTPRVTWLLPVKDGMPFLPETLASIEAQTSRDWEILAWDNGSTDGTLDVLREWIPSRLPGRVISDRPLTLAACLAALVRECRTDLCARIDADDVNAPDRLARQLAFLDGHPDVAAVGSWTRRLDAQGETRGLLHTPPPEHEAIIRYMLRATGLAHPTVLFRRTAVLEAGNYRDVPQAEDYDLWLRMAARHKLANIDAPLVDYRVHPRGATLVQKSQNVLDGAMNEHFAVNAPALFGCSPDEARRLRGKRHPFAFGALYRMARHRHRQGGPDVRGQLRSEEFRAAGWDYAARRDVGSRLMLAAADPERGALRREAVSVLKSVGHALGLARPFRAVRRLLRGSPPPPDPQAEWLAAQALRGAIHPSLEFTGAERGFDCVDLGVEFGIERDVTVWIAEEEGAAPRLTVGDRVFVGRNTYLGVFHPITIGRSSLIGAYSYLISASHVFARRDVPIQDQGFVGAPIVIEDDVWLGTRVVVLPGVRIGRGAIVAAGSVVNRDIPPFEIWGGAPARFIKQRPG